MTVRIGFDMDGVLADFAAAFRDVEHQLFGPASNLDVQSPDAEPQQDEQSVPSAPAGNLPPLEGRQRRDAIWKAIQETEDFWVSLKPLDPTAVARIHEMVQRKRWEVMFLTQRPATAGQTVQRQTQVWLQQQGFDLPSVLVTGGSRGAAAAALRLTYHVDDTPQHCFDVSADSRAKAILIVSRPDTVTEKAARTLGIGIARSIAEALDFLERVPQDGEGPPGLLDKLSKMIGWR